MVSDRCLEVYLDGALCGRITQTSSGNLTFEYERNYRTDSHATHTATDVLRGVRMLPLVN